MPSSDPTQTAADLAGDAIGLFLEYRDSHGYDEDAARVAAIREVTEGEQARLDLHLEPRIGDFSKVRVEYVVCRAAGYPDPFSPHPNTLEAAREFMREHAINGLTKQPTGAFISGRLVSDWGTIERMDEPGEAAR